MRKALKVVVPIVSAIVVAALIFGYRYLSSIAPIATGYTAKILCSSVYVSGRDYESVNRDVSAVVRAAAGHCVKVIIEAALLTDEEKVAACAISADAGAHYVKTSTGFAKSGATVEDVALMRRTVGPDIGVKAAGGIRDEATARAMIAAGATRVGASASVKIVGGK